MRSTFALAVKCGNIDRAARDRFHIGKRRPDEVPYAGGLRRVDSSACLFRLVCMYIPGIGHHENAIHSGKCGFKRLRTIEIGQNDFIAQLRVLGRVARQRPHLELTALLQRAHNGRRLVCPVAPTTAMSFWVFDIGVLQ